MYEALSNNIILKLPTGLTVNQVKMETLAQTEDWPPAGGLNKLSKYMWRRGPGFSVSEKGVIKKEREKTRMKHVVLDGN